jgi:hypothetical protein
VRKGTVRVVRNVVLLGSVALTIFVGQQNRGDPNEGLVAKSAVPLQNSRDFMVQLGKGRNEER